MRHKLFTVSDLAKLARNGKATREAQANGAREPDHVPVVKIFNPYGGATWLLTESDPAEPDVLFGLCDLGQGYAELGTVLRSDLEATRVRVGQFRWPLERDLHFRPRHPLSVYTTASNGQRIVEHGAAFNDAAAVRPSDQEQRDA